MDASILKYQALLETVRQGSFTRAAEALSYSQSGVSRMVADLEREWGFALLERGRGGVRLTADGERVLPAIEAVVSAQRSLSMQVDDLNGLSVGTLRIGAFSSVATHRLPRVIHMFQDAYPNIEYEILMGDYAEIERWVRDGRVDLGFLPYEPAGAALAFEPLELDEMLAVLPRDHRLAAGERVAVADLCAEPFILLEKSGDDEVTSIFSSAGLIPQIRFRTWDDYAIMSMVDAGLGLAILPQLILTRCPYDLELRPLEPVAHREIGVVYRREVAPALVAQRFLEYLRGSKGEAAYA